MIRKLLVAVFLVFAFTYVMPGQSALSGDVKSIVVQKDKELGLVYNHVLRQGETLYSLSKYFNISLEDLLRLNKVKDVTNLAIGHTVLIPFDSRILLKTNEVNPALHSRIVPVYYRVAAKENIYRISKHYFDQSLTVMKKRNKLNSDNLSLGQQLIVGWLLPNRPTSVIIKDSEMSIEDESRLPDSDSTSYFEINEIYDTIGLYIKNQLFADSLETTTIQKILKKSKEIAIWDKSAPKTKHMFALHRHAAKNSIIEIFNPLINRTAYATVIAGIPEDSYPDDVTLIISPGVAQSLGALDRRFMVEVKYYMNKTID